MSVMSMEGDKIQNMTVILVYVILGSYGSDNEIYHLVTWDAIYSGFSWNMTLFQ
jgi:hypothetical protein